MCLGEAQPISELGSLGPLFSLSRCPGPCKQQNGSFEQRHPARIRAKVSPIKPKRRLKVARDRHRFWYRHLFGAGGAGAPATPAATSEPEGEAALVAAANRAVAEAYAALCEVEMRLREVTDAIQKTGPRRHNQA